MFGDNDDNMARVVTITSQIHLTDIKFSNWIPGFSLTHYQELPAASCVICRCLRHLAKNGMFRHFWIITASKSLESTNPEIPVQTLRYSWRITGCGTSAHGFS